MPIDLLPSMPSIFDRLRAAAPPGTQVRVRIAVDNTAVVVKGTIQEYTDAYLVLSDHDSLNYISSVEILGFGVILSTLESTPAASGGHDMTVAPAAVTVNDAAARNAELNQQTLRPTISIPSTPSHDSSPSTTNTPSTELEKQIAPDVTSDVSATPTFPEVTSPRAAYHSTPLPSLHLDRPAPDFDRPKLSLIDDTRAAYVHALNVWNYARKVREPERVIAELRPLKTAAELANDDALLNLAGQLALFAGRPDLAKPLFELALESSSMDASYGAAVANDELGNVIEALDHLTYYLGAPNEMLPNEQWASLIDKLFAAFQHVDVPTRVQLLANLRRRNLSQPETETVLKLENGSAPPITTSAVQRPPGRENVPAKRHIQDSSGRIDRVWQADQYGLIILDSPNGKRSVWFEFAAITDRALRKAVELGWRGGVTFQEVTEERRPGTFRRSAINVAPLGPIRLSSSPSRPTMKRQNRSSHDQKAGRTANLQQAKRRELSGDLDGAESLYQEIIARRGDDTPTAVKELAWLLNRKNRWAAAIELLDNHNSAFRGDRRAVDNLRLNILLKGKQYDQARFVIQRLQASADDRQWLALLKQDVYCLIGLSQLHDADALLANNIERFPDDASIARLRERIADLIEQPGVVDLVSLQNIGAGITEFSLFYLETSTLVGADERSKARGYFDAEDFKFTYEFFNRIQGHRPRERAQVMLTLAHICWRDPLAAGEQELADLLRRFFSLMAESQLVSGSDPDSVRTFATEALALSRPDQAHRELPVLLETYLSSASIGNDNKWRQLAEAFESRPEAWHQFLSHVPYYESRCPHLREVLQRHLVSVGSSLNLDDTQLNEHANEVRRNQLRQRELLDQLRQMDISSSIGMQELERTLKERASEALFALDAKRLGGLAEAVVSSQLFLTESDYMERRAAYGRVRTLLQEFFEAVDERATLVSIVGLRPFAERLSARIEADQQSYLRSAKVQMSVADALVNDRYQVEVDSSIRIPLLIEVHAGGPPIEDLTIEVDQSSGLITESLPDQIPVLHAGQPREVKLRVKPSVAQIAEAAFTLNGLVTFKALEKTEARRFSLPIRLNTEGEFEDIANPYESYSGGTVVSDPDMFYGRDELVLRILQQVTSGPLGQCYLLYGQKRSGKSSVLEQVRQNLLAPVIPVKLTMGELDTVDANYSFLRVCLSELKEALRDRDLFDAVVWPSETTSLVTLDVFKETLRAVCRGVRSAVGEEARVVYLIDEFTYMFGYIRSGVVDVSFMRQWKALIESHLINTVVVGQDSMPRFKAEFPNEFGVTRDERLSYLTPAAARALAQEPIPLDGGTRYRGRSLDRLLVLSGGNPWFLQIMCDRLVVHLNSEKAPLVTESDIDSVARSLIAGEHRLNLETFDPLITAAGDAADLYAPEDYLDLLRQVAWHSGPRSGARADDVSVVGRPDITEGVVEDLVARDVLRRDDQGLLRITVGLFESWLRVNRPLGSASGSVW